MWEDCPHGLDYETEHLDFLGIRYEKIIVPDVDHDLLAMYERVGDQAMKFHSTNLLR